MPHQVGETWTATSLHLPASEDYPFRRRLAGEWPTNCSMTAAAQRIYTGNVFPAMHVTFGTYRSNLGHLDSPGCCRCHDDLHKSKAGAAISQDCELCHKMQE